MGFERLSRDRHHRVLIVRQPSDRPANGAVLGANIAARPAQVEIESIEAVIYGQGSNGHFHMAESEVGCNHEAQLLTDPSNTNSYSWPPFLRGWIGIDGPAPS